LFVEAWRDAIESSARISAEFFVTALQAEGSSACRLADFKDLEVLSAPVWFGTGLAHIYLHKKRKGGESDENSEIVFGSSASRW
jgi:hypothetical protein